MQTAPDDNIISHSGIFKCLTGVDKTAKMTDALCNLVDSIFV